MHKVTLLPKWIMPGTFPSVYDTDSGTCIEMTAKVYNAMRNLQTEYNEFVEAVNKTIVDFINDTNADYEAFKCQINKLVHDYIRMLDDKVKMQDLYLKESIDNQNETIAAAIEDQNNLIDETIVYIKNNLVDSIKSVIDEMRTNDEFNEVVLEVLEDLTNTILTYNATDESLTLINPLRPATSFNEEVEELTIINIPEVVEESEE